MQSVFSLRCHVCRIWRSLITARTEIHCDDRAVQVYDQYIHSDLFIKAIVSLLYPAFWYIWYQFSLDYYWTKCFLFVVILIHSVVLSVFSTCGVVNSLEWSSLLTIGNVSSTCDFLVVPFLCLPGNDCAYRKMNKWHYCVCCLRAL